MGEYAIHGGNEGSRRLEILNRTLEKSTLDFLKRAKLNQAINVLDLGCGIGSVTAILAELIGDQGRVRGLDIDKLNIKYAINAAQSKHLINVSFETYDVYQLNNKHEYDLIYSRFLLSHLSNPKLVIENAKKALKSGGKLLIEETDFTGHFSHPKSAGFNRYVSLYQDLLRKRGANANFGKDLLKLLKVMGFSDIQFQISQPAHMIEEGKLMAEITFKGISQALIDEKLMTKDEFLNIYSELIAFRKREDTIMSLPRIFQLIAHAP